MRVGGVTRRRPPRRPVARLRPDRLPSTLTAGRTAVAMSTMVTAAMVMLGATGAMGATSGPIGATSSAGTSGAAGTMPAAIAGAATVNTLGAQDGISVASPHGRQPVWGWPLLPAPAVTRGFSPPPQPWRPGHRGVDLAGEAGQPVRAAGAGVVVFAGQLAGRGVISVDHPSGLRTTYEPVTASIAPGDAVSLGEEIGTLEPGHDGCPVDACLHWGLRRDDTYLDPLLLVRPLQVRLKPR